MPYIFTPFSRWQGCNLCKESIQEGFQSCCKFDRNRLRLILWWRRMIYLSSVEHDIFICIRQMRALIVNNLNAILGARITNTNLSNRLNYFVFQQLFRPNNIVPQSNSYENVNIYGCPNHFISTHLGQQCRRNPHREKFKMQPNISVQLYYYLVRVTLWESLKKRERIRFVSYIAIYQW